VEIFNGRVDITYGNEANVQIAGRVLSLTLYENAGGLQWLCGRQAVLPSPWQRISAQDATTVVDLYLPDQCRP
jgi:hypothetical protein